MLVFLVFSKIIFCFTFIIRIFTSFNQLNPDEMINSFTSANLNELRKELEAAVAAVAARHGIDIKLGSGRYSAAQFSMKMDCNTRNTDIANSANAMNLRMLGLPVNAIGRTFMHKGIMFTVTGINRKKRKYPVETKRMSDNAHVNFGSGYIASMLSKINEGG